MEENTPEDNSPVEPEYLKGFNEGYIIAEHEPELAEKLMQVESDNPRHLGFQDGRKQYLEEQKKDKYPSWLKRDYSAKKEPDTDKDKNKDIDMEPER